MASIWEFQGFFSIALYDEIVRGYSAWLSDFAGRPAKVYSLADGLEKKHGKARRHRGAVRARRFRRRLHRPCKNARPLRRMGCDYAQGLRPGLPLAGDDVLVFLSGGGRR